MVRMSYASLAKVVGLSEAAVPNASSGCWTTGVMQIVAVNRSAHPRFTRQVMVGLKVAGDMRPVATALADIPR